MTINRIKLIVVSALVALVAAVPSAAPAKSSWSKGQAKVPAKSSWS